MNPFRGLGWAALLAAVAWLASAGALGAAAPVSLEEQERQIAAELRCPVCQNLSVADSPSPLAQEMRAVIREQLQQGKTREQIVAYFESKYGEWALLAPKPTGFNLLAYVVPLLAGGAGVLGVLLGIRRWVRRRQDQAEAAPEVSAADRERLRQALEADEEEEGGPETDEAPGPLAELEAQRAALYAAIRELEFDRTAGMISEQDYEAMRRRTEADAVGILRRLDALAARTPAGTAPDAPRPAAASRPAPRQRKKADAAEGGEADEAAAARTARRRLWVAAGVTALVAFAVLAGALLTLSIRPRHEGGSITGGPLTGTVAETPPIASASEPGAAGGARRPLDAATMARMLQAAKAALDAGRFAEAAAAYRAVLERDPRNVEAITRMGNILERQGQMDLALEVYDKALAIDPRSLQTLWDKGSLLFQRANYAGALTAWQALFEAAPPGPDRDFVELRMADARARLAASGPVPRPAAKSKAPNARPEGS